MSAVVVAVILVVAGIFKTTTHLVATDGSAAGQAIGAAATATPSPSATSTTPGPTPSRSIGPATGTPAPTVHVTIPPDGCPSFPDAACTGYQHTGTTLTTYSGPNDITKDNTVISGALFSGRDTLYIHAHNVTIRNSKFENQNSTFMISMDDNSSNASLLVVDTEMVGAGGGFGQNTAIRGQGWSFLRVDAHNFVDIGGDDGNNTVQGSYFHDFSDDPNKCDHSDGLQSLGGTSNITIIHNTILENLTFCEAGAIQLGTEGGGNSGITIAGNLIGGGAHAIYCGGNGARDANNAPTRSSRIMVVDNHFTKRFWPTYGQYSVSDNCADASVVTWTGNVDAETGAEVKPNF